MLSSKQRRFAEEYVISLNATDAALKAGYSAISARSIGSENLKKPDVIAEIHRLENVSKKERTKEKEEAKEKAAKTRAELLEILATLLDADLANIVGPDDNYLPLHEWPAENAFWLKSFKQVERIAKDPNGNGLVTYKTTRVEFRDRIPLLIQIGKMLDIWARKPTAAETRDAKIRRQDKLRTGVASRSWHEIAADLELERRERRKADQTATAPAEVLEFMEESRPQNPEPEKPPRPPKPWKRRKTSRR